jgi:2-polyprenyl-6-methoxyphenol hydroxylase-like FAD-dependent oxidoreductase
MIRATKNHRQHYPVCIVGGGPVGVILSGLLHRFKVPHCVIEKRKEPTKHPQAHFLNARTMEIIMDSFPSAFDRILKEMPPSVYWR